MTRCNRIALSPAATNRPRRIQASKTYEALLGPLHGGTPSIMTECLFVDPVADIAVLGEPDYQISDAATDAFDAFAELVDGAEALSVGSIENGIRGFLLSLDDNWITCILRVNSIGGPGLWIAEASAGVTDGMSGSPIIGDDGRAIGVVCTSTGTGSGPYREDGPNPGLMFSLPGWLLKQDGHKEN